MYIIDTHIYTHKYTHTYPRTHTHVPTYYKHTRTWMYTRVHTYTYCEIVSLCSRKTFEHPFSLFADRTLTHTHVLTYYLHTHGSTHVHTHIVCVYMVPVHLLSSPLVNKWLGYYKLDFESFTHFDSALSWGLVFGLYLLYRKYVGSHFETFWDHCCLFSVQSCPSFTNVPHSDRFRSLCLQITRGHLVLLFLFVGVWFYPFSYLSVLRLLFHVRGSVIRWKV